MQTVEYGEIWHTENDTLQFFATAYPGRIESQLDDFTRILTELLLTLKVPDSGSGSAKHMVGRRSVSNHHYIRRDGRPFGR